MQKFRFGGLFSIAVAVCLSAPLTALAYVGPGAGITMLGSLWGLIVAIVFVVAGLLILPFKLLRNRLRQKKMQEHATEVTSEVAHKDKPE
jgi:amino acid transporter